MSFDVPILFLMFNRPSFFSFCAEMLQRFRDDESMGSISGNNFLPAALGAPAPYLFSKYVQIWGWATWRRFWANYSFELTGDEAVWQKIIEQKNPQPNQARYWMEIFGAMRSTRNRPGALLDPAKAETNALESPASRCNPSRCVTRPPSV